ncbi:cephalosporin hydroxylase family protein [Methanosarcina sp. 1.H.A.2.2]|uniref:cephalosporin hydroxylase family protein n=1 Tax=Methanosarcina sp. 1.H.A.2.2 TaxID=1483601 RepID=UPI0006227D5B|nr:cephalosporin hydroxylase family protein [Methanosarcina sp. 1.H.A.2.2]KKH47429.1 cephalosporin hydroxylase [Methanosarcina sp. 1.H.A.2.2]
MDKNLEFKEECRLRVANYGNDVLLKDSVKSFVNESIRAKYSYNFTWLGRPIIQYPQDIIAMQEIIWQVKPDLIIETGIAHGGSLIFYASMLELLGGDGHVVGIDIDIRKHNRAEIEKHTMFKRITMIEGSSTDEEIAEEVRRLVEGKKVLVCLDSNHTHEHVLRELELYAPLVSVGSYCVVFDTIIEDMPNGTYNDRPWDVGNNPKTAVWAYLKEHEEFVVDEDIENKLLITVAPSGYLKRVK